MNVSHTRPAGRVVAGSAAPLAAPISPAARGASVVGGL